MPDLPQINANIQRAIHPPSDSSLPPHVLQYIGYALQLMDAENSAKNFKQGAHETNPMMRPFSHGGAPTMALGFALGDLARHALLRHSSQGTKNTADAVQAAANLMGILQTDNNIRRLDSAPTAHALPIMPSSGVGLPAPTPAPPTKRRGTSPPGH